MPVSKAHVFFLKNFKAITPNPEYKALIDETARLYQSGKVDKRRAEIIVRKLSSGKGMGPQKGKAMVTEIKNGKIDPKMIKTKAGTVPKEPTTFFIRGTAKTSTYYYRTRNKAKTVKFNKEYIDSHPVAETITAYTKEEAEKEFKQNVQNSFNLDGYEKDVSVQDIFIDDVQEEKDYKAKHPLDSNEGRPIREL